MRQRLEASKRGAEAVQQAFGEVLTRKVFAKRVGVHVTTIRRWEDHGIIHPALTSVLGIPTLVFTEDDVKLGSEIVQVLRDRPGALSLRQAAELAHERGGRDTSHALEDGETRAPGGLR